MQLWISYHPCRVRTFQVQPFGGRNPSPMPCKNARYIHGFPGVDFGGIVPWFVLATLAVTYVSLWGGI